MSTVAAIDCGTNSTRLLVVRDGVTIDRRMVITRLGQGVAGTGRFRPDAIERTLAVLADYRAAMDEHGVERVRAAATSAARDAANRDELLDAAEAVIGVRPEVLGGDEEGRLSFAGATAELDPAAGPFLVVDIGGGSTEFAVGTGTCDGVVSVDIGCVRVTEEHLVSDPPKPEELSAALSVIEAHLDDVVREEPEVLQARRLIGLAGTITTVAAVEMGMPTYDRDKIHHFVLTHDAAEDVFRTLATESREQRLHNPGLEEARADVIVGGCCVLVKIFRHFDFDEMLVSEADILDGLAASIA
jgi:exopolyphosphatase/guanosine-5'-triphosphate,3'-diphosphate pyrophosphatase